MLILTVSTDTATFCNVVHSFNRLAISKPELKQNATAWLQIDVGVRVDGNKTYLIPMQFFQSMFQDISTFKSFSEAPCFTPGAT